MTVTRSVDGYCRWTRTLATRRMAATRLVNVAQLGQVAVDGVQQPEARDVGNTEVWQKSTKVLLLHGGLHLYRTGLGQTYKRTAGEWGNLLDDFGTPIPEQDGAVPLFVSEGSSNDKLRSIYTSDYLSFAYTQFSRHSGPLVIFGHTLDSQFDRHLVNAIRGSKNRVLAIGLHPPTSEASVVQLKARWVEKFSNFELKFFDSSTHPLGSPELHVEQA